MHIALSVLFYLEEYWEIFTYLKIFWNIIFNDYIIFYNISWWNIIDSAMFFH